MLARCRRGSRRRVDMRLHGEIGQTSHSDNSGNLYSEYVIILTIPADTTIPTPGLFADDSHFSDVTSFPGHDMNYPRANAVNAIRRYTRTDFVTSMIIYIKAVK